MRIAHIVSYFQPKLGYQEYYLAKRQQEMGHETCVITSDRFFPFPNYSDTVAKILGERYVGSGCFKESELRVFRLPCLFEYGSTIVVNGLYPVLTKFKPTIVHAHVDHSLLSIAALVLKNLQGYKVVLDSHTDQPRFRSRIHTLIFNALFLKNPLFRAALRNSDGYVAVSESARNWLSTRWGIPYEKIRLIPLGADKELFTPNPEKREIFRKKLGLHENDIVIVYAGKIIPSKEIENLLFASTLLNHKKQNVKILLVGDGPMQYMKKLQKLSNEYGIAQNVNFHKLVPVLELPNFYRAADIGVWPGSPSITIVEAMACGLPIIIPKYDKSHGVNLCHYLDYNNGFVFERENPEELASCLEKLVEDGQLRKRMGLSSRKLVEEKLSWDVITERTLQYYEEILTR